MKFTALSIRGLRPLLLSLALVVAMTANARPDRSFSTTPTLAKEATGLIRLLEEVHYNREGVKPADYAQVIPDYMAELDGQRLFFLESDKHDFLKRFPTNWLYNNISSLGKIDPAYDIFALYESRAEVRINWIFAELNKDIDLTTNETYAIDRSKTPWPANAEDADTLWRQRLKFEVLQETLNKKTAEDAKKNIHKRYERMLKNIADIETDDLSEMFLSTITRMYDPHSTYFSANTYEDFGIQMRLQLVGIGALLGIEEDQCVIKEIITGGPADLSKLLHTSDKIVSVAQNEGEPVEVIGMKLRKIVDLIRGHKGTPVKLLVQPADATDSSIRKEIVLTRDVVNLNSARAHAAIFDVPDGHGKIAPIGVITLPAFYGPDGTGDADSKNSATRDVAELLRQLQKASIQGLVLDLRRNGGGLLSEAIDLTGLFIKRGPVVQVKSYYGDVKTDYDDDPSIAYTGPMAVLVSKFSASASEIVAGALQNYGRAVVVGDSSTHGKGSVQTIIEMKNVIPGLALAPDKTGATKLTIQKFYLPDGHSTQLKGVVPDIVLPSIDDLLPVGEKDLPHALVWDEIASATFDGKPLDSKIVTSLRQASIARQKELEEFAYNQKNIDWFKSKQDQKTVSLNLEERRKGKEIDTAFKKTMNEEREHLAKDDFPFREFTLGPPKAPKPKVEKKAATESDGGDDAVELSADDNDNYGKVDIPLRESMRVISDALDMGHKHELWASGRPPLTAEVATKG